MTTAVTVSDGTHIAVHDLGGAGRPMLLAHATGFHGRAYLPFAAAHGEELYVLAYDARGHGWPLAFGHSAGAASLLLAEGARPGTFSSLDCFEPIVASTDEPSSTDEPLPTDEPSSTDAPLPPDFDHKFVQGARARRATFPTPEAPMHPHDCTHDACRRLGRVASEVTLAWGETTDAVDPDIIGRRAVPRARVEGLRGIGHLGPLEDAGAVAASVRRPLAEKRGPGPGTAR